MAAYGGICDIFHSDKVERTEKVHEFNLWEAFLRQLIKGRLNVGINPLYPAVSVNTANTAGVSQLGYSNNAPNMHKQTPNPQSPSP